MASPELRAQGEKTVFLEHLEPQRRKQCLLGPGLQRDPIAPGMLSWSVGSGRRYPSPPLLPPCSLLQCPCWSDPTRSQLDPRTWVIRCMGVTLLGHRAGRIVDLGLVEVGMRMRKRWEVGFKRSAVLFCRISPRDHILRLSGLQSLRKAFLPYCISFIMETRSQ